MSQPFVPFNEREGVPMARRTVDNRTLADTTRAAEAREQAVRQKLIENMQKTERLLAELGRLRAEIKGIEVER